MPATDDLQWSTGVPPVWRARQDARAPFRGNADGTSATRNVQRRQGEEICGRAG